MRRMMLAPGLVLAVTALLWTTTVRAAGESEEAARVRDAATRRSTASVTRHARLRSSAWAARRRPAPCGGTH